ncbi:hypothetical protein ACFCV3_27055 [Kribbella sp. NPDC056345]|uniref:hypothetical protein n=1 Tax=Kribbella sp. NPDC056345 TaxID=3345789 RepID=UPI0035E137A7
MAVLLLIAAHTTTTNMITLALLEHPDQRALLHATDDLRRIAGAVGAVGELLR